MLFGIVEGSGSMARCSVLVQAHSGEITPTIMEAPARVQLRMVKDPGVKLLGRWVRDEMAVPSLPQLRAKDWEYWGTLHSSATYCIATKCCGLSAWVEEPSACAGLGPASEVMGQG